MIRERHVIRLLAINEFYRLLINPLTIIVFCVLIALTTVNGIASIKLLPSFESWLQGDVFIKVGFTQELYEISLYCSIAALVFGLMTIAGERKRALGILLTKPVSKKAIVAGKFLGVSLFMLLLIITTFAIMTIMITLAFRGPLSVGEFALRVSIIILALLMECSLLAGIGMLIGIVSSSLKEAIIIGTMFLFVNWFTNGMYSDIMKVLCPPYLYFRIISATDDITVFDTMVPFDYWLSLAWPYIILMILAIVAIFAINCYAITKNEDL